MNQIEVSGREVHRYPVIWEHIESVVVDGIKYQRRDTGYSSSLEGAKEQAKERTHRKNFFCTEGEPKSHVLCGQCLSDTFHVKCKDTYYPVCSKCGFCADD